jgi:hypothetical protein
VLLLLPLVLVLLLLRGHTAHCVLWQVLALLMPTPALAPLLLMVVLLVQVLLLKVHLVLMLVLSTLLAVPPVLLVAGLPWATRWVLVPRQVLRSPDPHLPQLLGIVVVGLQGVQEMPLLLLVLPPAQPLALPCPGSRQCLLVRVPARGRLVLVAWPLLLAGQRPLFPALAFGCHRQCALLRPHAHPLAVLLPAAHHPSAAPGRHLAALPPQPRMQLPAACPPAVVASRALGGCAMGM